MQRNTVKLRRYVAFAVLAVGLQAAASQTWAQATLARVKERGTVNVGYGDNSPPFSVKDAKGHAVGYSVDLCKPIALALAKQAGLEDAAVRWVPVPVDQMERYVKGANVDLMCGGTSDTPQRRMAMDFSVPIQVVSVRVAVRAKDGYKALKDVPAEQLIAAVDRTTAVTAVERWARANTANIGVAKAVGAEQGLGQVKLGWAAGFARDDVLLTMQLARQDDAALYAILPDNLGSENIAIAFARGDMSMGKLVTQSLAEVAKSGAWDAAYKAWFQQPVLGAKQALNLPMPDAVQAFIQKQR
jgi:glutamate/aspartate transport system substrate-binding protein